MIDYNNLVLEAKKRIPIFNDIYNKSIEDDIIDTDSGNHIVFGYVFTPSLVDAINRNDSENIRLMFDFLEEMSKSEDINVVEVCDQSVLEALNDQIDSKTLIKYMKPETYKGYQAIKEYME